MDALSLQSTSSSNRRKLVKRNTSSSSHVHHHHHLHTNSSSAATSPSLDAAFGLDDHAAQSRRSSHSLSRAPSSPHTRSATHSGASIDPSSPRHIPYYHHDDDDRLPIRAPTSIASSSVSTPAGTALDSPYYPSSSSSSTAAAAAAAAAAANPNFNVSSSAYHPTGSLARQPSDDLIGAPFDGAAILDRLDSSSSKASYQLQNPPASSPAVPTLSSLHPRSPAYPPAAASQPPTDKRLLSPRLRSSASFSSMDPSVTEKISGGGRPAESPSIGGNKRFSEDGSGRDFKSAVLRKKSGLSGFVNSLVGSQKKPAISAPENPVHLTHVGYDSSTGQFTVCWTRPDEWKSRQEKRWMARTRMQRTAQQPRREGRAKETTRTNS